MSFRLLDFACHLILFSLSLSVSLSLSLSSIVFPPVPSLCFSSSPPPSQKHKTTSPIPLLSSPLPSSPPLFPPPSPPSFQKHRKTLIHVLSHFAWNDWQTKTPVFQPPSRYAQASRGSSWRIQGQLSMFGTQFAWSEHTSPSRMLSGVEWKREE